MIIELSKEDTEIMQALEAKLNEARKAHAEAQEAIRKRMLLAVARGGGKTKTAQGQPIGWEFMAEEGVLISNE